MRFLLWVPPKRMETLEDAFESSITWNASVFTSSVGFQELAARTTGTFKEPTDAAISTDAEEGKSRKLATKTDKRGEFVQLGLQSGGYRVTATADKLGSGFADVRVRVGNTAEVTITLSPVPPGTDPKMAALKLAFDEGVTASRAQDYDTAITKFQAALRVQPALDRLRRISAEAPRASAHRQASPPISAVTVSGGLASAWQARAVVPAVLDPLYGNKAA